MRAASESVSSPVSAPPVLMLCLCLSIINKHKKFKEKLQKENEVHSLNLFTNTCKKLISVRTLRPLLESHYVLSRVSRLPSGCTPSTLPRGGSPVLPDWSSESCGARELRVCVGQGWGEDVPRSPPPRLAAASAPRFCGSLQASCPGPQD